MPDEHSFIIADFLCRIAFVPAQGNDISLIPSFEPFTIDPINTPTDAEPLFTLTVDNSLRPFPRADSELIRVVNTGASVITVHQQRSSHSYQFAIATLSHRRCCLLQCDPSFATCACALSGSHSSRAFGLNNALMLTFAFAACAHQTLLIHASALRHAGRAYAFTAPSGTGKSTHTALWLSHIPDCDLINDDNPILRHFPTSHTTVLYGSPWSGKTPCYRPLRVPLGAIVKLDRAPSNSVTPAAPVEAFVTLLAASATMKWDATIFHHICTTVSAILSSTPAFHLLCLPNPEAAILCHSSITTSHEQ